MINTIKLRGHHIAFIGECINGSLETAISKVKSRYGRDVSDYISNLFKSLNFLDIKITEGRDSICTVCSPGIKCIYSVGLKNKDRECLEYYHLEIGQKINGSNLIGLIKDYYKKTGSLSPRVP